MKDSKPTNARRGVVEAKPITTPPRAVVGLVSPIPSYGPLHYLCAQISGLIHLGHQPSARHCRLAAAAQHQAALACPAMTLLAVDQYAPAQQNGVWPACQDTPGIGRKAGPVVHRRVRQFDAARRIPDRDIGVIANV